MGTFKQISTKNTKYENISKYLIVYVKNEIEHVFFSNSPTKELIDNGAIYNIAILNTLNHFINNENIKELNIDGMNTKEIDTTALNYMFVARCITVAGLNACYDFIVITNKELSYEFLLKMNEMLYDEEQKSKNFLKLH